MATAEQKGKKPRTDGEECDLLDAALVASIEKLQEIQDEIEKVNEEACDKVLELEQKYNEVRRPVYVRRNEIIKQIPDFWLTAFLSHPVLGELLTEDDQKIFKHLESIDVDDSEDIKSGYSITLTFSPNPYFEDTKLTKVYSFSGDEVLKVKATSITWKKGMDIANDGAYTKKGDKRILIDERLLFLQVSLLGSIVKRTEVLLMELWTRCSLRALFAQVGDIIREDLWPNPLKYFNNEFEEEFELVDEDDEDVSDIRDVPDHQEVFVDPARDESLIFELLDLKGELEDGGSALWFLRDIANEQDAGDNLVVEHSGTLELAGLRLGDAPAVAGTAVGQLAVSKGRQGREAQNILRQYLANIRLKNAATDVVITAYEPLLINPLSESARAVAAGLAVPAEQAGCLPMSEVFKLAVMNFNVLNWNLFNGST
uniref:Uncharacterized protein n=1 Tax=Leersia perrieri TaxID=77586 RepID=A0A0D9W5S8_9ORYZ